MKKLSNKAKAFLGKLKAQDGMHLPYIDASIQSVDDFAWNTDTIQPDLQAAQSAQMVDLNPQSYIQDPGSSTTTQQPSSLNSALGLLGPVGNLTTGVISLIKAKNQRKEAKLMDKMFKQDNERRMENARASGYYNTPYTVGRTSDLTMKEGGNVTLDPLLWAPYPKNLGFEGNLEEGGMIPYQPYFKKKGGKISRYNPYHMQDGGIPVDTIWPQSENEFRVPSVLPVIDTTGQKYFPKRKRVLIDGDREKEVTFNPGFIKQTEFNYEDQNPGKVYNSSKVKSKQRFREMQMGGNIDPIAQFMEMYQNQEQGKNMVNQTISNSYQQQSQALNDQWKQSKKQGWSNLIQGGIGVAKMIATGGVPIPGMSIPGMQDGGEIDTESLYSADFQGVEQSSSLMAEDPESAFKSTMMEWIMEDEEPAQGQEYSEEVVSETPTSGGNYSSSTPEFSNVIDAIAYNESRGRYDVVNEKTQTVGKYQFMEKYWADKIRDYMGLPASMSKREVMNQFKNTPDAQEGFMKRTVAKEYMPEVKKMKPYADKYGLTEDDLVRIIHYRGIKNTWDRLRTGDFEVSQSEQEEFGNPSIEQYLGKQIKR